MTIELIRTIKAPKDDIDAAGLEPRPRREWLVANGLGGYASGTVAGLVTRRYHGVLVAALPAPLGRIVMLNHLLERVRLPNREVVWLGDEDEVAGPNATDRADHLIEFRLELGLPVWRYRVNGCLIEKRIVMPHGQNTVHVSYTLLEGEGPVRLTLRPSVQFRGYEAPVNESPVQNYSLTAVRNRYELSGGAEFPCLRFLIRGPHAALTLDERGVSAVPYQVEASRGYEALGALWSPGYFRADLETGERVTLIASTESWDVIEALTPEGAADAELERRRRLVDIAARLGGATGSPRSWCWPPTSSSSRPAGACRGRGTRRRPRATRRAR